MIPVDTIIVDSIAAESAVVKEYGMLVSPEEVRTYDGTPRRADDVVSSWILSGLILLFALICFKFRKNLKYIGVLVNNLTDTRVRGNMFDDTARETFFITLLNLLSCASAGIMLVSAVAHTESLTIVGSDFAVGFAIASVWEILLLLGYNIFGRTFFSSDVTSIWIKGYLANQGLLGIVLFFPVLLLLASPDWTEGLLILCIGIFSIARIIFIGRSLRIFFSQKRTFLLFLCYLCSVEIVPVLITYESAKLFCY